MKYEIYRVQFPNNTSYFGYTADGIEKHWASDNHNAAVLDHKKRYPDTIAARVEVCDTEEEAKAAMTYRIRTDVWPCLNHKDDKPA